MNSARSIRRPLGKRSQSKIVRPLVPPEAHVGGDIGRSSYRPIRYAVAPRSQLDFIASSAEGDPRLLAAGHPGTNEIESFAHQAIALAKRTSGLESVGVSPQHSSAHADWLLGY